MITKAIKANKTVIKTLKSLHSFRNKMNIEKRRRNQETLGVLFGSTKGISYETFKIEGLPVEWIHKIKANDTKHIILYFHGGAYTTGNLTYARILGTKLASVTDVDVLTVEYRLAPENPYPAALEDAIKAWDYLINKGYDNNNIAVVGESAGGNLVLSLIQFLKSNKKSLPTALVCMSPWADLMSKGKSYEIKKDIDPILTKEFLEESASLYAKDLLNPLVSPLYSDFKEFPSTFIQVGSNEILLSDSIIIKDKLKAAGVDCYIEVWQGMWHVFQMFPMKKSMRAMQNVGIFLTSKFSN